MRERNLMYFVSAVIFTVLFLLSLIVRTLEWFPFYGDRAIMPYYQLIIPLILVWGGWFLNLTKIKELLTAFMLVMFTIHLISVVNLIGNTYMPSAYAPLVKTFGFMSLLIMFAFIVVSVFEDVYNAIKDCCKKTKAE